MAWATVLSTYIMMIGAHLSSKIRSMHGQRYVTSLIVTAHIISLLARPRVRLADK
jgi:hypothetical protein